jgi:hypothetical protein
MNHDRAHARNRLFGLALELDRGKWDAALGDGDADTGRYWAELIAARCRTMADAIDARVTG